MRRNRGTTLVEMALVLTLTTIVVGVLAGMYGFSMSRLGHATASFATTSEASSAADAIEATIRESRGCEVYSSGSGSALKCTLPASGTDRDGDGFIDTYTLSGVTRRGVEKWGSGRRIWFYLADSSGAQGTSGSILWRAQRSDDLTPTSSNVDKEFSYATSDRLRRPLIDSFSFSVDTASRKVTFTIVASSLTREERLAGAGESSQSYTHTETRTVAWRNGTL